MALTHLIDTSVLKRLGAPQVRAVVEPLLQGDRLARTGISDLEVGYSARNESEWSQLMHALEVFTLLQTTDAHLLRAVEVQGQLAAKSQRGRKIPDLLVAAAAEANHLTVLHYDHDFDLIAGVTGQRCDWVVPAGSVD